LPEVSSLSDIRPPTGPPAPIQELLGFDLIEVGDGTAAFRYEPDARHRNPLGTVHGGIAMTLLDSAAGAAVHSTLTDGASYATLETKVNLVRPIKPTTGPLHAEGRVLHRGAAVATAEGRLVGEDRKLYAHATSTCMIMPRRPQSSDNSMFPAGKPPVVLTPAFGQRQRPVSLCAKTEHASVHVPADSLLTIGSKRNSASLGPGSRFVAAGALGATTAVTGQRRAEAEVRAGHHEVRQTAQPA
jgi:uncharacterized protein (TIGR00369 family)